MSKVLVGQALETGNGNGFRSSLASTTGDDAFHPVGKFGNHGSSRSRDINDQSFTPNFNGLGAFSRCWRIGLYMGTSKGWKPNGARYRKSALPDPIGNRGP